MGAEPHDAAAGRRPSDDVHRDAMWRRDGGAVATAPPAGERSLEPVPPVSPARGSRSTDGSISPWSREAIEAPLPTVDEIRERWRAELGLDDAPPRTPDPLVRPRRERDAPGSTATGEVVLGAIVVALLLVVAGAAAWALRPSGEAETSTASLPSVTDGPMWTTELAEPVKSFPVAHGAIALPHPDGIVVHDLASGEVRWSASIDADGATHRAAIYDGVVMVVSGTTIDVAVAAYDLADGVLLWQRSDPLAATYLLLDDAPVEVDGASSGEPVARVIDPATGEPVGDGVVMRKLPAPDGYLVGDVGDDLALLDVSAAAVVSPAVPSFGLRAIAPVGDRVVGFTVENEIVVFDDDGVAVDRRPFVSDAFGDFSGRAELLGGVPGTSIGIVASGTSVGFDVSGGQIELMWELRGRILGPIVETADGPRAVARLVDAETGVVEIAVVDVTDGSVVAVTNGTGDREAVPQLAADGYVVPPAVGDPDRVVSGVGYDGTERWSLPLGATPTWSIVRDGVLFVVGDGTLTAYG